MPNPLQVSFLVAATVIGLVFVPLGWSAAVLVVYKVASKLRKWARYLMEIHTALLTIIVGAMVVPMQMVTNILSFANIPIPISLELTELLTMRICQSVMIISVATVTMKRVRTTKQGSAHSKSMEIGSIVLAWAIGLSIGIGTTYHTARDALIFNQTSMLEDGSTTSRLSCQSGIASFLSEDYFNVAYIGLLLMTSLVIFGGCLSVTRHIQSSSAGTTHESAYRLSTLARGLKDNIALENITGNGRKATIISGHSQDLGSSKVLVDNWVSEQSSLSGPVRRVSVFEPTLSKLSFSSVFSNDSVGMNRFLQSPRPRSSALMYNPVSTRKNLFEIIEERDSEVEGDASILSDEELSEALEVELLRTNKAQTSISREFRFSTPPSLALSPDCPTLLNEHDDMFSKKMGVDIHKTILSVEDTQHTDSQSKCSDQNSSNALASEVTDSGTQSAFREDNALDEASSLHPAGVAKNGYEKESPRTPPPVDGQFQSLDQNSIKAIASEPAESDAQSSPSEDIDKDEVIAQNPPGEDKYEYDKESTRMPPLHDIQSQSLDQKSSKAHTFEYADSVTQISSCKSLHPLGVDQHDHDMESTRPLPPLESQCLNWKCNIYVDKQQKEQLNESKKRSYKNEGFNGHTENVKRNENPRSTNTAAPLPVQTRVTRPSKEVRRYIQTKSGCVQDGVILKIHNETETKDAESDTKEVHSASQVAVKTPASAGLSVPQMHSIGSTNFPRCCCIQLPQRHPARLPIQRRKKFRYTEKVIKRFVLAFIVNIVTQIPYAALQMATIDCQTFKTVQPFLQSIALITFAVSPYVYILGHKMIHKQLIGPRRT